MSRVRLQRAAEVSLGIPVALSAHKMERAWFDAWALVESQVDEMWYDVNADRWESTQKKSPRRGG